MTAFEHSLDQLQTRPRSWLVTGVAGFIGSHLLEKLLLADQTVRGFDDFSTGSSANLAEVKKSVSDAQWRRFDCMEGTILDLGKCRSATRGIDFVLHHAGFVSVPGSLEDPLACHDANVTGTLNLLITARDSGASRFVYASSSAVYGDDNRLRKVEATIGNPLSPYAASKRMGELYANLFARSHQLECVGLRYFNIYGPRQNPEGGYAAVIPRWIRRMLQGERCVVHGDGLATRDFCHVANVVQANVLAATSSNERTIGEVFNVGSGTILSINQLYAVLVAKLAMITAQPPPPCPKYAAARSGDILHSAADISKARQQLGYEPHVTLDEGLEDTIRWDAGGLQSPARSR